MPQTLSVIKAGVGGFVGGGAVHPEVIDATRAHLATVVSARVLLDAQAHACGDTLFLILSHEHGEGAEPVHRAAWDALTAAATVAERLHQHGPARDLLPDAFTGNLRGAGPGVAELEFVERPSEPVVVLLGDGAANGAFNLPLARTFADPFTTPGLVLAESLHEGFSFEVHDAALAKKIMFNTPEETYDLLAFIGLTGRYVVKRVIARATGEVVVATSSDPVALGSGHSAGRDDPTVIVRCHGAFPTVAELTGPYATPQLVDGALRGSHVGAWLPVGLGEAASVADEPRVVALGFQVAEGRLGTPRDLFADAAFDAARAESRALSAALRRHGPFTPHRLPMDSVEVTTLPAAAAKLANRWSPL
ncbi:MAG: fructose 1,6-bisphosphatase [Dehalococcoidia bacterium]|nr:fructose 1,6-bisphosphatase [Dehalococcoidia bacterium]